MKKLLLTLLVTLVASLALAGSASAHSFYKFVSFPQTHGYGSGVHVQVWFCVPVSSDYDHLHACTFTGFSSLTHPSSLAALSR